MVICRCSSPPLSDGTCSGQAGVRDGQAVHNIELHALRPSLNGSVETRGVKLDGDRLTLASAAAHGRSAPGLLVWQRAESAEPR
jgi:hypothetical protein